MIIIYIKIHDQIVIITLLDFNLLKSDYSVGMKDHLMYGLGEYEKLSMMTSYTYRRKRLSKEIYSSYTVSTPDGFSFYIIDKDGTTRFSFQSLIQYESLAGRSFPGVNIDQFLYEPHKYASDKDTKMFHTELDRLIQADADDVSKNPKLPEERYVPYHRGL